nr:B3 domain-containing protein At1g05920-like [Ipomoea batatas]
MAACLFSCFEAKSSSPQQSTSLLTRMLLSSPEPELEVPPYYLGGIDLNESLITPSNHTVPDKEEWRKKLMGSFYGNLSWQNVLKSVVQSTARSNIPESVVSHSSGSDERRASLKKRLLLAVCERERLLLHKEEQEDKQEKKGCYNDDDADQYYLHLGGVDLNQSLITPSLPDEEEWKKKLMGSFYGCLSWHNNVVVKPVVQSTTLTNTPESVISHSSDEAASLKYDEAVAEKVNNSKKRKRGSRVPNNGPEPPPELPVEFRNLIHQLAGNRAVCVEKLVIQKELTKTDVNSTQNRLSIPARLVREEFLTEEEHLLLCQHNGKNVCSIEVPLITPMMEVAKQPRQHLQALLLPTPQCPLCSLFSLISYHWPVPAVLNSPNELHSVSLSQDLPSEVLPSVVEQLQKWVLMAEAIIEQNEKENAALKEQVKQFESRWPEYEAKMNSMEECWVKKISR